MDIFCPWNIKIRYKRKSEVRVWTAAAVVMDEVGAWQTIGEVCMYVGMRTWSARSAHIPIHIPFDDIGYHCPFCGPFVLMKGSAPICAAMVFLCPFAAQALRGYPPQGRRPYGMSSHPFIRTLQRRQPEDERRVFSFRKFCIF